MALAHAVAGVRTRGELPARGGAPFINAAAGFFSHLAYQCSAAWPGPVGAAHAAGVVRDFFNQAGRDAASMFLGFVYGEVDTKGRAAGAATEAGMRHDWGGIFPVGRKFSQLLKALAEKISAFCTSL